MEVVAVVEIPTAAAMATPSPVPMLTDTPRPSTRVELTLKPTRTSGEEAVATPTSPVIILPLPDAVTFEIGEGVDPRDLANLSEGMGAMHAYLEATFEMDAAVARPFTVKVVATGRGNQDRGGEGSCCTALSEAGPRVFFDVRHPDWLAMSALHQVKAGAQAYAHVWQAGQGCVSIYAHPMGRWLTEGMAEYVAWASLVSSGRTTQEAVRSANVNEAKAAAITEFPSMQELEFGFPTYGYAYA